MLQSNRLDVAGRASSHRVSSGGSQIHYRLYNDDSTADGLLLTHGITAHSHWWDEIAPAFTDRFRVAAMDTAGMGDSDHRERYTARGFGEDVVAVIKDAGLAPVTLVAHSFSGNMALHACGLAPELIRRVVIIDSRVHTPGLPVLGAHERPDANLTRRYYPDAETAVSRYRLFNEGSVTADRLRYIAAHGLRQTESGWTWKFDINLDAELSADPDRAVPTDIATPVDYIYGESSELDGAIYGETLQRLFRNCGVPIGVPGYGHNMMLESPELVIAMLRALFARPVG